MIQGASISNNVVRSRSQATRLTALALENRLVRVRRITTTKSHVNVVSRRLYSTSPQNEMPNVKSSPPTSNANANAASSTSQALPKSTLLQRYAPSLSTLSTKTGVPLPSLGISFLILHELTAILPVILLYWVFSSLGIGLSLVSWILDVGGNPQEDFALDKDNGDRGGREEIREKEDRSTVRGWIREWYVEGENKIVKVGKRYGILGFEKTPSTSSTTITNSAKGEEESGNEVVIHDYNTGAVTKVADAIAAYVVVKALLPLRIGISIGAAPAFARYTLNPVQNLIRRFRR